MLRTLRDKYSMDPARKDAEEAAAAAAAEKRFKKGEKGRKITRHGAAAAADAGAGGGDGTARQAALSIADLENEVNDKGDGAEAEEGKRATILERAVDPYQFRRLLRDLWGCPEDALFLSDRIFEYMDSDGSGSMDVSCAAPGKCAAPDVQH